MSSYKTYYSLPSKAKKYCYMISTSTNDNTRRINENDTQQSTVVVWEGIGLILGWFRRWMVPLRSNWVGLCVSYVLHNNQSSSAQVWFILNTQQQTLTRSTIYNVWSAYVDLRGTNFCMDRGRTYILWFFYTYQQSEHVRRYERPNKANKHTYYFNWTPFYIIYKFLQ
jgi:hypothetical protein